MLNDGEFGATDLLGYCKRPRVLPFSFRFCESNNLELKPEVHVVFDNRAISPYDVGTLKLYGDWEFTPREADKNVSAREVKRMKTFFRNHLVLFCAVWTGLLPEVYFLEYLIGGISFDELMTKFTFYSENAEALHEIHELKPLEQLCRDRKLVNFYGSF